MLGNHFATPSGTTDGLGPAADFTRCTTTSPPPILLAEILWATGTMLTRSAGPDGITREWFHRLLAWSPNYFEQMYNTYLLEGFVPSNWRESYVLPLRKPHLPSTLTTSYRPISLTSIASKVFEKIILQRLLRHLQNGNYLSPQVFGFYPARSTTECLMALFHDILIARERKQFALLCSVDLAKAYDTVSHAILFRKLERMHIPTELLTWIRAFLTNRKFRVRWKSHLSPPFPQSLGLPQGMVLSPILFALFIQDMENVIHPQVRMYMYADDVCLLATSHNWKTVCSYLSGSLTGLTRWSTENQMSFTPRKSGILNLSRRRPGHYCGFLLQDQAVPQVAKLKFLGLWIQESLQWKEHLHYVKARVVKRLSILRFIGNPRWGLTSTQLLQIVNLTIRPILLYAGPVLYSAPTYIQQEFERLHSAALRACIGVPKPTPLVVLRCASGTYELLTHLTITTTKFLIRHLSLGQDSPLARILSNRTAVDFYHWGPCNAPIVTTFNTHERAGLVDVSQVQKSIFYAPTFLHRTYKIILHTLLFQQRDLPQAHVPRLFAEYLHTLPPATHLVGSDAASKHGRNAIGIYSSIGTSISHRIHGMFTIFSAEALAIMEGIADLVHTDTPTCVLFF